MHESFSEKKQKQKNKSRRVIKELHVKTSFVQCIIYDITRMQIIIIKMSGRGRLAIIEAHLTF